MGFAHKQPVIRLTVANSSPTSLQATERSSSRLARFIKYAIAAPPPMKKPRKAMPAEETWK